MGNGKSAEILSRPNRFTPAASAFIRYYLLRRCGARMRVKNSVPERNTAGKYTLCCYSHDKNTQNDYDQNCPNGIGDKYDKR
jgi:hypothetical protein